MRHLAPILTLTLALTPVAAAAQTLFVTQTEEGYLNLRDGPGARFEIIRRLSPGDAVRIQETQGKWARVRLPDDTRGWTSMTYLEREADAFASELRVADTGPGYLNLRSGPGTDFDVLQRMSPGDRLEPLENHDGWTRVRLDSGREGWAFATHLTR